MSHSHSHGESDTVPLHPSSQSDIDEIENLINASVQSGPTTVLPAKPPSPTRASIPVSSSPFIQSNLPPLAPPSAKQKPPSVPPPPPIPSAGNGPNIAASGFGSPPNTLTEPVWDTVKRDLSRIVSNLKLVVFPNPYREDPGKALRDWDLWGPSSSLSSWVSLFPGLHLSRSLKFLRLHLLYLLLLCCNFDIECTPTGRTHNFLSEPKSSWLLLIPSGYWSFNLYVEGQCDIEAVNPRRKALALYPVFLLYVSVGFLIIAID
ncbi:hypothetical protein M0R45_019043 [Rubus argutus]|uniref:Uncharacterized protein n=1 Tax=Rubus argutus TaxID=59490 RepID=A0AAW1X665_RUBAR